MRKLICLVILMAGASYCRAQEQDFDAWRRSLTQGYQQQRSTMLNEYQSFRQKVNAEYAEHMRQVWKEFRAFKGEPVPEDNVKPVKPVPFDDQAPMPIREQEIPVVPVTPIAPTPEPQPQPIEPIEEKTVVQPHHVTASYCGTEVKVRLSERERFTLPSASETAVAETWKALCTDAYGNLLYDCLAAREKLHLCDWAYLNMLSAVCDKFLGQGTNESTLLLAWIYCQSGYMMRLGRSGDQLEMLYGSKHIIYRANYYEFNGVNFYPWHTNSERLRIFNMAFEKEKPMSLYVTKEQALAVNASQPRELKAKGYPEMVASVAVNRNDLTFFDSYPTSEVNHNQMSRWAMYAQTPISQSVRNQLYPVLKSQLEGLSPHEAANRLLNWVQTAFTYEYDDKVWGGDRAFFAEETLYYPYCDCEDRSILFSHLVRDLLGLDVLLVYYPGHLATAVAFPAMVNGDYIIYNNKRFTVADPTYIGAPVGRTMPRMDNATAKVILL